MKEQLTREEFGEIKSNLFNDIKVYFWNDTQLWRLEGIIILLSELTDCYVFIHSNPTLYKISIRYIDKNVTLGINRQDDITLESHNYEIISHWKEEICYVLTMELKSLTYENYLVKFHDIEDAIYSINDANCVRARVSDAVEISCNEEEFLSLSYRQFIAMYELEDWLEEDKKEKLRGAYEEIKSK